LVRAVLAGDERAFNRIWHKYVALVRSKLGHVRRDIDDCVQEVFVRLHARLPYLRDPTALSSFIIGITLRVAGTELRRRKSASWILLTPTGDLPEPTSGPQEDTTAREAFARFQAILAKLGPRARRVFELRYIEHKELVDVAAAMNVSLATAKRHLARVTACVHVMAENDPLLVDYLRKSQTTAKHERCSCFECVIAAE
jgi:RNA polymerase sigma-70 factor (ECF subfamily)